MPTGFRAEFAEPIVLAYDPHAPEAVRRRQELIASELELPFVSLAEWAPRPRGSVGRSRPSCDPAGAGSDTRASPQAER